MQAFSLFSAGYTLARQSGFLNTGVGSRVFVSAYFWYKKHLEDPFDKLLARQPELFRGGHLLDVGANIGYCSSVFARAVDRDCRVFAFEPEAFNFALLERVIRRQRLERVVATQAAVGAREGKIGLVLNPRHHGDHRVNETGAGDCEIPLVSLDGFLAARGEGKPVRLIKIDVQGYELAVVQGAARTLERNTGCAVILEYMPEALSALGVEPAELLRWFAGRGYRVDTLELDGSIRSGFSGELPSRGYVDLVFSRG